MATRTDPTDPANLTSSERLTEVAAILAAGIIRLRRRAALSAAQGDSQIPPESGQNGLDVCPEFRLHGQRG